MGFYALPSACISTIRSRCGLNIRLQDQRNVIQSKTSLTSVYAYIVILRETAAFFWASYTALYLSCKLWCELMELGKEEKKKQLTRFWESGMPGFGGNCKWEKKKRTTWTTVQLFKGATANSFHFLLEQIMLKKWLKNEEFKPSSQKKVYCVGGKKAKTVWKAAFRSGSFVIGVLSVIS